MAAAAGNQEGEGEEGDEVTLTTMMAEGPVLAHYVRIAEGSALEVPLRGASDAETCLSTDFGQSDWCATTSAAFFEALPEMKAEGPYEFSWATSKTRVALLTEKQLQYQKDHAPAQDATY